MPPPCVLGERLGLQFQGKQLRIFSSLRRNHVETRVSLGPEQRHADDVATPEAAVSNPPRSSRRCSSPSTVDSAARRACYEQPGPALPGGRAAAVRVRGPNLGEYADSLVAKAQVRATLATISDDAYNEYLDLRSLEETREEVAGTPSPESRDWLKDDDE